MKAERKANCLVFIAVAIQYLSNVLMQHVYKEQVLIVL